MKWSSGVNADAARGLLAGAHTADQPRNRLIFLVLPTSNGLSVFTFEGYLGALRPAVISLFFPEVALAWVRSVLAADHAASR